MRWLCAVLLSLSAATASADVAVIPSPYAEGRGANVLDLVGDALVDGTSAPAWASTRVRVERIGEGELVRFGRSYEEMGHGEVIPVGWAPHEPLVRIKTERSV